MLKTLRTILLLALLSVSTASMGQSGLMRCEIGFNGGGMNYLGDLNDQSMLGRLNWAGGALFRYRFDDRWSLRIEADYGHIEAGNPRGINGVNGDCLPHRNLSFLSHIIEGSARMEFNFRPFGNTTTQSHWTPYIFGGIGLFSFNPTALYTNSLTGEQSWVDLQPLGTEGQGTELYPDRQPYQLIQLNMPFGLGFKFKPNPMLMFSIEYGFRKTWTDYLDDCSTTYVGDDLLNQYHYGGIASSLADRSGEVDPGYHNAIGIKRGDDSLDDWYAYINASICFRLDKLFFWVGKKRCEK